MISFIYNFINNYNYNIKTRVTQITYNNCVFLPSKFRDFLFSKYLRL